MAPPSASSSSSFSPPTPLWLHANDDDDVDFDTASTRTSSPVPSGRTTPHERHLMLPPSMRHTPVSHTSTTLPPGALPPTLHYPPLIMDPPPPLDPPPSASSRQSMARSLSSKSLSPLNPAYHTPGASSPVFSPPHALPFTRPSSRGSNSNITRIPSEETRALALAGSTPPGTRNSFMILYRRADSPLLPSSSSSPPTPSASLPFHTHTHPRRPQSISTTSYLSLSSDSKYPTGWRTSEHGLIAYAYDPSLDERDPSDEEDLLHDPDAKSAKVDGPLSWRGFRNFSMLAALVAALLCLFIVYPVISYYHDNGRNALIVGNTKINASGQAPEDLSLSRRDQLPFPFFAGYIDPDTPPEARIRTTVRGHEYSLIFSDEFQTPDRVFSSTDADAFWVTTLSSSSSSPPPPPPPPHPAAFHDDDSDSTYTHTHTHTHVTTKDGDLVFTFNTNDDGGKKKEEKITVFGTRRPMCLAQGGYVEMNVKLPYEDSYRVFYWAQSWRTDLESGEGGEGRILDRLVSRRAVELTVEFGLLSTLTSPLSLQRSQRQEEEKEKEGEQGGELRVDYIRVYGRDRRYPPSSSSLCGRGGDGDGVKSILESVYFPLFGS